MKKKIMLFLMALVMTGLVLGGCSSLKEKKASKSTPKTEKKAEVGIVKEPTEAEKTALSFKEGDKAQTTNGLSVKLTGATAVAQEKEEYLIIDFEITNDSKETIAIGAGDFEVNQGVKKQELFGLTENIGEEIKAGETLKGTGSYTWVNGEKTGTIQYSPITSPFESMEKTLLWHIQ